MMPTRRPARRRWLLPMTLLTCAVIGLAVLLLRVLTEQNLLSHAHRIVGTQYWPQMPGSYFWLDDKTLFCPRSSGQAVCVDTRTGKEFAAKSFPYKGYFFSNALSPDRQWLLASNDLTKKPHAHAYRIDGARQVTWAIPPSTLDAFWLGDSRRWVDFAGSKNGVQALIHTLDGKTAKGAFFSEYGSPVGVTPSGHLITIMRIGKDRLPLYNYALLKSGKPQPRITQVQLPPETNIDLMRLSPKGDQIAFLLSSPQARVPVFLRPFAPRFAPDRQPTSVSLWVSKADGSGMHSLGRMMMELNTYLGLEWTPDGKHLSFLAQEALYTVSAAP